MCVSVSKGSPLSIVLRAFLSIFLLSTAFSALAQTNPPLNVQGRVLVDGLAFNGPGKFKFAIVQGNGLSLLWTHDGSSTAGPNFQPTNSISLSVQKGLYSVLLGDPSIPGMTNPLNPNIFNNTDVRLRVWFDDGVHGFQQLTPDQRIAAVGYAYQSQRANEATVFTGSVTISQLPSTLVTNNESNVSLTGTFNGDGSGLIGIRGSTPFQVADAAIINALPNTGYLITNPVQRVVLLPDTADMRIGDIVRVAGPGSWKVAQNTNQSIFASHFRGGVGATWVGRDQNRNWTGVASSTNGMNLAALVRGGFVYLSTNAGVNWTTPPVSPVKNWQSIASSADGSRYVAGTDGEFLYVSIDNGQGWSARSQPGSRQWTGVASSHDGTNMVACAFSNGPIFTSADGGDTWQQRATAGARSWTSVACSADGLKMVATSTSGIGVSNDRGANWFIVSALNNISFTAVACSSDGARIFAGAASAAPGSIYTSTDGGTNWVKRDASGVHSWRSITCSGDGTIVAATSPDGISVSVDAGGAWTVRVPTPARDWRGIASAIDASRFAAAAFGNLIYISEGATLRLTTPGANGYLAGGEYSAVELQHAGNGKFFPLSSSGQIFAY
jgi:hypothetical protein